MNLHHGVAADHWRYALKMEIVQWMRGMNWLVVSGSDQPTLQRDTADQTVAGQTPHDLRVHGADARKSRVHGLSSLWPCT